MIYDYVALDVETTGLSPSKDRLLEIGAAQIRNGEVCRTYGTLINIKMPVPQKIQELTGITDFMARSGKEIGVAIHELTEFCGDLPILGHNVQFDFGFVKQAAADHGFGFEKEALDTLKIARKVLPELPSRSLQALCGYYQIDAGSAHRALDDALSAHQLLWKLWESFGERQPEAFVLDRMTYEPKKTSPITKSQKGYLKDLLKYHKIELGHCIEDMTKSEASRTIDQIISQYGRIMR